MLPYGKPIPCLGLVKFARSLGLTLHDGKKQSWYYWVQEVLLTVIRWILVRKYALHALPAILAWDLCAMDLSVLDEVLPKTSEIWVESAHRNLEDGKLFHTIIVFHSLSNWYVSCRTLRYGQVVQRRELDRGSLTQYRSYLMEVT